MSIKNWVLIQFLTLFLSCNQEILSPEVSLPKEAQEEANETMVDYHLLFVGNSLTYYNDLPALVKEAAADKGISIATKMLAKSNYAIIDHWQEGEVQTLIQSRKYDYIIIQQGPSSQPEGYDMLLQSGQAYAALCKANDVQLAYFMVWPALQYYHTFEGVIANYSNAAKENEALLCPVGATWKTYIDRTNDFSYYGTDGFHPSVKGSLVAADMIVNTLFPL